MRAAVLAILLFCVRFDARALPLEQVATPQAESACVACHTDAIRALDRSKHAGLAAGCAACHDESARHSETGTAPGSLQSASVEKVNGVCLRCHDRRRLTSWTGSAHERNAVACTSCHSAHSSHSPKSLLKSDREQTVCFRCHASTRAELMRNSHHPLREGHMDCSSCHDVHDGSRARLLRADSVNEVCYSCHAGKRGPFLWEHAPVQENCLSCHQPHGSNHARLLVAKSPYLCQRCHSGTDHASALYDLRSMRAGPTANRVLGTACSNCHTNIHGSNAPGGVNLGR